MTRRIELLRVEAHARLLGALTAAADAGQRIPCVGHPSTWDGEHPELQQAARFACETCDQFTACRNYVTSWPEPEGIWAGLDPKQQRRLHKETH